MKEILDSYKTLKAPSEGLYKEKGSKFIAFAIPVRSEDEIKVELEELRKKYHDARHHCYAWTLGVNRTHFRANDDGEPSNSAGKPILGQLDSFELTQLLIVVIRYFGGVKLGVGGLINAYRTAAKEAILNGQIVKRKQKMHFNVFFEYPQMNDIMQVVKTNPIKQLDQKFELDCELKLACPNAKFSQLKAVFLGIENVSIKELGVE